MIPWISQQLHPPLGTEKIRESIRLLEKLGLVFHFKGRWKQNQKVISTASQTNSFLIGNYHRSVIHKASEAIESVAKGQREFRTICLTLNPLQKAELMKKIESFWLDTLDWCESQPSDSQTKVCQLNLQFFPYNP